MAEIASLNALHRHSDQLEAELAPGMAAGDVDACAAAAAVLDEHYEILDRLSDTLTTALRVPETERADLTGSLGNAVACRGTFEWMFDDEFQHRYLDQVSGGQRRRAIVAMVLAEGSPVEIMRPEVLERIYDFPIRVETIDGVPYAIYFRPPTRHGAVSISSRRSVWADQSSP